MAQGTNKNLQLTAPPIQSNVQNTPVRPQKEWFCPICGAIFDQEQTKDSHMTGCKRNSYHQQYSNYVVIDSPKMTSQPVTLCLHTRQCSGEVSYISDTRESYPLVWNYSKSLYSARVSLKPGQNKGRVHFTSADKSFIVESFEVSQYPPNNSSIEILIREGVAIPNPNPTLVNRSPPISKGQFNTAPSHSKPSQKEDEDIYANVGQLADNIRLSHEVDQLKERVKELENENTLLKEENARSKNIIEDFYTQRRELESELSRLKNARGFENDLKILPTVPLIKPRPDKQKT